MHWVYGVCSVRCVSLDLDAPLNSSVTNTYWIEIPAEVLSIPHTYIFISARIHSQAHWNEYAYALMCRGDQVAAWWSSLVARGTQRASDISAKRGRQGRHADGRWRYPWGLAVAAGINRWITSLCVRVCVLGVYACVCVCVVPTLSVTSLARTRQRSCIHKLNTTTPAACHAKKSLWLNKLPIMVGSLDHQKQYLLRGYTCMCMYVVYLHANVCESKEQMDSKLDERIRMTLSLIHVFTCALSHSTTDPNCCSFWTFQGTLDRVAHACEAHVYISCACVYGWISLHTHA